MSCYCGNFLFRGLGSRHNLGLHESIFHISRKDTSAVSLFLFFISLDVGAHVGNGKGKIFLVSWDGQAFLPLLNTQLFGILSYSVYPSSLISFVRYTLLFLFMFMFYLLFISSFPLPHSLHFCPFVSLSMGRNSAHPVSDLSSTSKDGQGNRFV